MSYMGESQEAPLHNVGYIYGPQVLLGEDPFKIETIIARMDKLVYRNYHSKALVDYALHDLVAKAMGVPLYQYLGGRANERIELAYVMSSGTPQEVADNARKLVSVGYKGLKLKVGHNIIEEDVEMVAEVRTAVGSSVNVMTDTNGGWDYMRALRFLNRLKNMMSFWQSSLFPLGHRWPRAFAP